MFCLSLPSKEVASYLVVWVKSCLSGRSCQLLFQGSYRIFSPLSVGTPQALLISPLLFVIYLFPLHMTLLYDLLLSYIDDFALTASSLSYQTNSCALQAAIGRIEAIVHTRKVNFSVPKTALIRWRTPIPRTLLGSPRPPQLPPRGRYSPPPSSSAGLATSSFPTSPPPPTSPAGWPSRKPPLRPSDACHQPALASPLISVIDLPTLSSSLSCSIVLTFLFPLKVYYPRWTLTGVRFRDGSQTFSAPLPSLFFKLSPAFPSSLFFSPTSGGWRPFS